MSKKSGRKAKSDLPTHGHCESGALDPAISLTKEGPPWASIYVFTHKSGHKTRLDARQYAQLVGSQR